MLNLGCVWDDARYGPEAVEILFDMISRNLPEGTEGRFFCFTDRPEDLGGWVEKRPLLDDRGKTIMFPLGCVIVRGLDALLKGEQVKTCFYDGEFPKEAAVVIFEDCRPQDCENWVKHVYKIGGGTTAELSFVPSVPKERLRANILSALDRDCPWFEPAPAHQETALVVGGGPSLRDELGFLDHLAANGDIFALNGVPDYLASQGIPTDFHVMLDAAPDCAAFVAPHLPMLRFYASQCDPSVLEAAGDSLVCWHGGGEAMDSIKDRTFRHIVGGGSTGLTRAIVLAYGLGYRKFHVFGGDSSYDGDRGHAYPQIDYERFINATCGNEDFRTSPQLLGQVEDFKMIAPDLLDAGCEITVHGGGLLGAVAAQMAA